MALLKEIAGEVESSLPKMPCDVWPIADYLWAGEKTIPFHTLLPNPIQLEASVAITQVNETGKQVLIAWEAKSFVIVELIEPIDDDEEKSDITAAGLDWRSRLHQSFDVLFKYEFNYPDSEAVSEWLENLNESATNAALRDFDGSHEEIKLFVLEDSSIHPSVMVMFSVGNISMTDAEENRARVIKWTNEVFVPLLSTAVSKASLIVTE